MPVQNRCRAAACALVVAVGVTAGCGGGNGKGDAKAGDDHGDEPAPVAVLGSSVVLDPRRITLSLRLRQPEGVDPPIARTATVALLGKGIDYDGAKQPTCAAATIRSKGVDACPKGAIVGTGEAIGTADTARTKAEITIINGGRDTVLFFTVVRKPAYVKTLVPGRIATRDDGLTIAFAFPPDLQDIGGVPVGLHELTMALSRGGAVTAALCGSDWRYAAAVAFADHTTARHQGRMKC